MVTDNDIKAEPSISRGGDCPDGFYSCAGFCLPSPCPDNPDVFPTYIHLRVVLDSLETFALRYFLEGDEATRKNRVAEILGALQPALEIVGAYAKTESPQ